MRADVRVRVCEIEREKERESTVGKWSFLVQARTFHIIPVGTVGYSRTTKYVPLFESLSDFHRSRRIYISDDQYSDAKM